MEGSVMHICPHCCSECSYLYAGIFECIDINSGYILRFFLAQCKHVFSIIMTNILRSNLFAKEHEVTLLSETGKSNWSLIGWSLIEPADDLSISGRHTVQSLKGRSRPHLEVLEINHPESCWGNSFGQGLERKQIVPCYCS